MVQQSPQNLPPVYNGEKMVVYGVLTHKGSPKDQTITGKAILKGQILGKKMEHSVPFTFNPVVTSSPSLPTIHHLAAKSLIKDWQDQGKSKEEIVKLSIESSVISSHTAFIAVDEENSEPVTGAMKTWDIQATKEGYDSFESDYSSDIPEDADEEEFDDDGASDLDEEMDECEEACEVSNTLEVATKRRNKGSFAAYAPPPRLATVSVPSDTLTAVIIAQQADGSWKLDTTLAELLTKSQKVIEDSCPTECKDIVAAVWATVLILTLLRKKYSSQQDEWELIAMKAESWVKKQTLPSRVTIQDLYSAAEAFIINFSD